MKKILSRTNLFVALVMLLIASLIGATTLALTANAAEEAVSTVKFTSYTTVMSVDEEFEFAAQVINEDGTVSDEVTWSSSDEDVILFEDGGLAYALAEGKAIITATAEDGASASVEVNVYNSAIRVESVTISPEALELGVGWHARVYASVIPTDATDQSVVFSSSDTTVVTVTEDGYVTAVAAGTANVIAMSNDGSKTAMCEVTVTAGLIEAELSDAENTLIIGASKDLTVVLPEDLDLTDATYQWTTSDDEVASFDTNNDETGTLSTWSFGTVELNVLVTLKDGTKYGASGSAYVTADYFYLVGIRGDWTTYDTATAAEEAGVLMIADAAHPGIFSIEREFWAYDSFQIIHSGIDDAWTTKITPYWYVATANSDQYVANTADMFEVNARGDYNVTLDLTSGKAKVYISMVDLWVTEVDLSLAEGQNGYLETEGDTTTLDVTTLPANGIEVGETGVVVTVSENAADYVTAELTDDNKQVVVTLIQASTTTISFTVTVKVNDAVGAYPLTIRAAGVEYTDVTEIAFDQETYYINVNNGGEPWTVDIKASVNADASIQGVYYMSQDDSLTISYDITGEAYVTAGQLGTFTIEAYALGNTKYVATAQVVVYSENGFYLIGILGGERVNNWASLEPSVTTLEGTDFEPWALTETDATHYVARNKTFEVGDQFSIAFLGMNGEWTGVINNAYFNAQASDPTITLDGINVQINKRGIYTVTLNLSTDKPEFVVTLEEELEPIPVTTYRYLYIVWSGSSWNGSESDRGNTIAMMGTLTFVDGVYTGFAPAENVTIDFYSLVEGKTLWPTIQFVVSDDMNNGDYFVNANWYGTADSSVVFGGDAYSSTGADGFFTNYGSELSWTGSFDAETNMTVSFSFTFEGGVLKTVTLNFVTPTVDPAE